NFGQVLVSPAVSVVLLNVGAERRIPTVQRTVVDVVHIHTEGQALVLLLQSAGRDDVQIAVEAAILLQANAVGFFSAPGINPVPSELVDDAPHTVAADKQLAVAAVLEQHLAELLELVFVQRTTRIVVLRLDEAQQAARSAALVGGVFVPLAKQQGPFDVQPVLQSLVPAQTGTLVLAGLQGFPRAGHGLVERATEDLGAVAVLHRLGDLGPRGTAELLHSVAEAQEPVVVVQSHRRRAAVATDHRYGVVHFIVGRDKHPFPGARNLDDVLGPEQRGIVHSDGRVAVAVGSVNLSPPAAGLGIPPHELSRLRRTLASSHQNNKERVSIGDQTSNFPRYVNISPLPVNAVSIDRGVGRRGADTVVHGHLYLLPPCCVQRREGQREPPQASRACGGDRKSVV